MDTLHLYSNLLSIFMSLIIAGTGLKLAMTQNNHKTYQFGEKEFSQQKVHTIATLGLLGIVIQIVADTMKTLDGQQLLLDEKILAAYAFSLAVLIFKK